MISRSWCATSSEPGRIVYLLSQQTGGPVDLTVELALELANRPGGPDVTVIGPMPITHAGDLGELWRPFELPSKFDVRGGWRLRKQLDELRPVVVHAQDRRSGLMATRAGCAVNVTTYHGVPEDVPASWASGSGGRGPSLRSRAVLAADAVLARASDRVVAPSASIASMLIRRLRVPERLVEIVPNGVRLPPRRPPLTQTRTIVFVGALIPRKAVDVAIAAFAKARRNYPDLRLRIVGDGPERERLESQSVAAGVRGAIEFAGYRRDVPAQLARADVFVLPSRNENQPLALLEAMAAGLACVATDTGGTAEVLADDCGLLVSPDDVDGLARAFETLAGSPGPAARMAQRAAERAGQRYSIAACADAHFTLYSRLSNERGISHRALCSGRFRSR